MTKSTPPKTLSALQSGIIALYSHDLWRAYAAFAAVYQAVNWQQRDLAVTAWGDIIDPRPFGPDRPPGIVTASNWQPHPEQVRRTGLSPERLLVLREGFLQPTLLEPNSITEKKTLDALRKTVNALENALIKDTHHLVRLSAALVLGTILNEHQQSFIIPTYQRALAAESDTDLRDLLIERITQHNRPT